MIRVTSVRQRANGPMKSSTEALVARSVRTSQRSEVASSSATPVNDLSTSTQGTSIRPLAGSMITTPLPLARSRTTK